MTRPIAQVRTAIAWLRRHGTKANRDGMARYATAVDAGLYTFTFAATGAQVKARYTYTYKWNGSQWLITSHHSSAMPEKN